VSARTITHAPHTNNHVHPHHVPTITHNPHTNRAAHTQGLLNDQRATVLLDSGASCSVVSKSNVYHTEINPTCTIRLVNADGSDITPLGMTIMTFILGEFSTKHKLVVADDLSTPVILGCNFLINYGYLLDFNDAHSIAVSIPKRFCFSNRHGVALLM